DARCAGPVVEGEVGDGADQEAAEAPPPVARGADEDVQAGVEGPGRVVTGQRIQVRAVDLPVAHRRAVEDAEARHAAALAGELRPYVVRRACRWPGQLPERGDGRVVHP